MRAPDFTKHVLQDFWSFHFCVPNSSRDDGNIFYGWWQECIEENEFGFTEDQYMSFILCAKTQNLFSRNS